MPRRLSNNLPLLSTSGNQIVDAQTQAPVLLRGVNLSGLEYSQTLAEARITEAAIHEITVGWNANIIRLPFNQEWISDPSYRQSVEWVISEVAKCGAYTLLDLQWLDARTPRGHVNGRPNYVAPLPNSDSLVMWAQIANLWFEETAILYDIFNEPHDPLPDDTEPLLGIREDGATFALRHRRVTPKEWLPWARQLITAIRNYNRDALIFVPGTNWAFDLRRCIMPDIENLVYSTHVYPSKGKHWDKAFGKLAASVPVFAGEWGGRDGDLEWGRKLATYFSDRGIGWTAWSWSDDPHLVQNPPEPPYRPTAFGAFVRELLTTSALSS